MHFFTPLVCYNSVYLTTRPLILGQIEGNRMVSPKAVLLCASGTFKGDNVRLLEHRIMYL